MVEPSMTTCNSSGGVALELEEQHQQQDAPSISKDTLDALILKGLDVIEEILDEQKKLEVSLREGFLLMSKARYSMGAKSVGLLQLPTEDGRQVEALVKVDHNVQPATSFGAKDDCLNFFVVVNDRGEEKSKVGDGLRKRTTASSSSSLNGAEANSPASSKTRTDPLNWFGVLVPQALRTSQKIFQDNVHPVCRLASLRSHLESIRREYARVSKQLLNLNMDNLEIK